MTKIFSMLGLFFLGILLSGTAHAKVGDKAWAACVWQKAPASAAEWVGLSMPNWQQGFDEKPTILAHRIFAICNEISVVGAKSPRNPKWKSLAKVLAKTKPKDVPSSSSLDLATLRCSSYTVDDGTEKLFLVDVVRREAGKDVIVFQQYFSFIPELNKRVMIPPGFTVVPKDGDEVLRKCQIINSDGSLVDA